VAIKQSVFDYLKTNYMVPQYRNYLNFIFGALSGIVGTSILYPTHMLKRVFQANSKYYGLTVVDDKDLTVYNFVKNTIRNEGVKGLYRGLGITYIKIIPYQGLLFWSNERLKVMFGYEKV
jgi:hypothetical protein